MLYKIIAAAAVIASAHSLAITPRAGVVRMQMMGGGEIIGGTGMVGYQGNGQPNGASAGVTSAPNRGDFRFGSGGANSGSSVGFVGNGEKTPTKGVTSAPPRDNFRFGSGGANTGSSVGFIGNGEGVFVAGGK